MKKFFVFLLAGVFGLSGLVLPSSANPNTQPAAYQEISRCLNSKNVLNVYFLVDSSGSLQDTDPEDKRAEVLSAALTQFAGAREGAEVNFALGTFSDVFTEHYPWSRVDGGSLSSAKNWIENEIPDLDSGQATDWLLGLRNATKALNNSPKSDEACKIMLWLTDGGINVPGKTKQGDADAINSLCAIDPATGQRGPGSLMDSIRRSGITVIGLLLKSEKDLARLKRDNPDEYALQISTMSYMRPIVESVGTVDGSYFGTGSSTFVCGESPIPATSASGVLVEVDDPNDLGLDFARIWLNASGGQPGVVDGVSPFNFVVEPGVSNVVVLLQAEDWTLRDAAGNIVASTSSTKDARVQVTKTGNVYQISIDTSSPSSQGSWSGVGPELVELYLYSNLQMDLTTDIQYGQPAKLLGQVVDPEGNPVGLSEFGSAQIEVTVVDSSGSSLPVLLELDPITGKFSGEFTPTEGISKAIFDVTLKLTTASGQVLKPIEQRIEQQVALGAEYPSLQPAKVMFSELSGPGGTANGTLNFQGSALGDSTVCLISQTILNDPQPSRIENYEWTTNSTDNCVLVPKGGVSQLEISVTNSSAAEGLVDGTLEVSVTSTTGETRNLQVPFEMQSTWPPNEIIRTAVLVILTLLSIFLPWLFLHLLNMRNSRLIAGPYLKRSESQVLISTSGVRGPVTSASSNPSILDVQPTDYGFVGSEERPKSYLDASGVELTGKAPRNPFGKSQVKVSEPAGYTVITNHDLDNDLGRTWFVVVSDKELSENDSNGIPAKLVSFKRSTGFDNQSISERNIEISNSLVWANLLNLVEQAKLRIARPIDGPTIERMKITWPRFGNKKEPQATNDQATPSGTSIWGDIAPNSTGSTENTKKDSNSENGSSGLDWS